MIRILGIAYLGLRLAWGSTALAGGDEGLFREMTLDQARRAASDTGKPVVLIDFHTTWCGPCKKLDETTWKDQGVMDWLNKKAVCLKVDAEKDEALAEKYRVNVYPTVLLLRPDGTEIDRLVGYRDPKVFLADAGDALAGIDSLSRARKQLEGAGANDPMLRMNYGDALAQKGRAEDALSEYLWCFDHGLEHGPGFTGVRVSFLLTRIVQLSRKTPTALDELRKRRDAALKEIQDAKADFSTAMGFTALNSNLGEPGQTLALYDRIKEEKSQNVQIRQYLFDQSLDQLLTAKRYEEIVSETDLRVKVRELITQHQRSVDSMPNDANLRSYMKKQVSVSGAKYYEALLGSGDKSRAAEVATTLTEFDPTDAYPPLIKAARQAGDIPLAEALKKEFREAGAAKD